MAWHVGEVVIDHQTIQLPPDITPGDYTVFIGWYDRQTQQRQNGMGANQQPLPDQVFPAGQVSIER